MEMQNKQLVADLLVHLLHGHDGDLDWRGRLLVKYQKARTLIGHEEKIYLNHDGKKMNSQE